MNKKLLIFGGIAFGILLFILSFLIGNYAGKEKNVEMSADNLPIPNEDESFNHGDVIIEEEIVDTILVSEAAERVEKGMTYAEVVQIMGRLPDTVVTDEIRKELGELPNGYGEINFEWLNDKSGCLPITIIFDLSTVTVVDVGGGNACFPNAPTEVFGKPCSETNLCDVAINTRGKN
jgi:hypothetical protein